MGKGRGHRFAQGACSSQAHEHWAEAERALLACVLARNVPIAAGPIPKPSRGYINDSVDRGAGPFTPPPHGW